MLALLPTMVQRAMRRRRDLKRFILRKRRQSPQQNGSLGRRQRSFQSKMCSQSELVALLALGTSPNPDCGGEDCGEDRVRIAPRRPGRPDTRVSETLPSRVAATVGSPSTGVTAAR